MVLAGRAVIWARVVVADGSTEITKEGNEMHHDFAQLFAREKCTKILTWSYVYCLPNIIARQGASLRQN